MEDKQRKSDREILARKQAGWKYLEEERRANLRIVCTKDLLPTFQTAFLYSLTLPPRLESGFTEFYAALSKGSTKD